MIAVIQFGGSNCDRDSVRALESLGFDAELVWHEDGLPSDVDGIMLPGGFSYGDYLRAGAMAARSPIMADIRAAAADGTPVLGVCNGAQIGCESALTPGAFTTNESARFQCEHVYLRVENAETPWTSHYEAGEVVELPIAHGEGRYEIDDERLDELEAEDRVLFKYCDEDGSVTPEANPNGSKHNVAGIVGEDDHVAVMMPHPERASLEDLGRTDGEGVLEGFAQ
ncbi:phosphoribosylformylglycinamidine synthase I [Haloarcula montana]|uniref:phosphoribosylformylglycinamidine synthase I n=1 Tax=Haloarcula montana TaxID=3111776 RepID=UPI002D777DAD|nr:phosphoribosylformylglycinamidine synthase I [Haloarcula sp. GH36]